jgi:hypothetical protein
MDSILACIKCSNCNMKRMWESSLKSNQQGHFYVNYTQMMIKEYYAIKQLKSQDW